MLTRGFAGSVLVLIGGVVISTLPESTALMQIALVTELRGAEAGRMAGLAVVLLVAVPVGVRVAVVRAPA